MSSACPFAVGDLVKFTPTTRTQSQYQDVEGFGIYIDQILPIHEIREGVYLYFEGGAGGFSYNQFTKVE